MRRPGWRLIGQAFGLGAVMALGQAPLGYWWLTVPALALLMRLWAGQRRGQAAWLGLFGGAGYFAVALNWIPSPFLVDAAVYGWMAPFGLAFMAFGLALFWALAAALAAGWGLAGMVLGLGAAELARGYLFTGFPWALIGHVWIDTPLVQAAAVVGANGLTLLTCAAAALLARWRPWPGGAAVLLLGAVWGFGLWQLARPDPAPPGITLRLVQPNAEQALKWDADKARQFLDRLLALTAAAPSGPSPDLVIWPETALPYLLEFQPELPGMIAGAAGGVPVALGRQRVEGRRAWNSLTVLAADGGVLAQYDKHHLVPFGEYVPLGDLAFDLFGLAAFAPQAGNGYSAGPGPQVLDLGPLGRVLPLICYEAVFPQDLRGVARPDWLLQITNDAWFGTLTGPFQHMAQARLRAVEQGLPLVRVANTGVTAMIDARGRVTAQLAFGTMAHLDADLPGALPATPYARWGEAPFMLLMVAGFAATFRKSRRPKA